MRKRRAKEKTEADVQKQQHLEEKRQEKLFEQAIIETPIYEAQAAAKPRESVVFKTMDSKSLSGLDIGGLRVFEASMVEALKPEFFIVAPEESIISIRFPG